MRTNSIVSIIIPCFSPDPSIKFRFLSKINSDVLPIFYKLGYSKIIIQPVDETFKFIDKYKTIQFTGRVPKGEAIREGIRKVDAEDNVDIVICIDGSGRIPANSLIDAIQTLNDYDYDAVFADRKSRKGITPERYSVERFEIFLVEQKYNTKIPDGQCGCWGFVKHKDDEHIIHLSAVGYEIELDFLTEVLSKKLKHGVFPVEITESLGETAPSLFNPNDHKIKIIFLAEKLGIKKWELIAHTNQFNKINPSMILPTDYINMLNTLDVKEPAIR